MLEYVKKVSPVSMRHLRRIDGRISMGGGWADVGSEHIIPGAEFNFAPDADNETFRVRALTVVRRPPNMEHAHVQVTPEITAEEIALPNMAQVPNRARKVTR